MGKYYSVERVQEIGKPVAWSQGKQPRVPFGCRLIAVLDRLLYKAAPDVTDLTEWEEFYRAYAEGNWVSMDVYAVPESLLEQVKG